MEEELKKMLLDHEKKDDERFAAGEKDFTTIKTSLSDIQRFSNRMEALLFPPDGSGQTPPLEKLTKLDIVYTKLLGAASILGILFTILTGLLIYVRIK